VIQRLWRCTWWPQSSKLEDTLGGCDRVSVEMHFEAMIEQFGGVLEGGQSGGGEFGREAQWERRLYSLVNSKSCE